MKNTVLYRPITRIIRHVSLFILITQLIFVPGVKAQRTDEQLWTTPVNLSRSGSTSTPVIITDESGVIHVVWQDEYIGSVYTFYAEQSWSQPTQIDFPFDEYFPILLNGDGFIHAFWIDSERDNTLFFSRVPSSSFGDKASWAAPKPISKFVADFSAEFQLPDQIHLAYIFTGEDDQLPVGVYYQRSDDDGANFLPAVNVYQSRYLRALKPEEANVQISTVRAGDAELIYITWDDRILKRVYFSRSEDQGLSWLTPLEVEGPTITLSTVSPFNLLVSAAGDDVVLVWQANLQSGINCNQYSQFSKDKGKTWSERQIMLGELVGCAQENKFMRVSGRLTLLQTIISDRVYFFGWNGSNWSDPQLQSALNGFNDPETNQTVNFRCRQSTVVKDQIFVVGCDSSGSGDIWLISRKIGDTTTWYPPPSNWDSPMMVTESLTPIQNVQAVMDPLGRFHFLWLQQETDNFPPKRSFYYNVLNGKATMAFPVQILKSPERYIGRFSLALDRSRNRLILTWDDEVKNGIFYSWANIANPGSIFEWAEPIQVPVPEQLAYSPSILGSSNGLTYIAYAVPINEGRGIYLVSSNDGGETWTEFQQIFNASVLGWQMIDRPELAETSAGFLHLLWEHKSIFGLGNIGLYYTRRIDGDASWSEPRVVVEKSFEDPTIIGNLNGKISRSFLTIDEKNQSNSLQEFSDNHGDSWGPTQNLTRLGEIPAKTCSTFDHNGTLNLVQIVEKTSEILTLSHQFLDNDEWQIVESVNLGRGSAQDLQAMACGIDDRGRLVVVFSIRMKNEFDNGFVYRLYLTSQKSEPNLVPSSDVRTTPAITPTLTIENSITPTITIQPIATESFSTSTPIPTPTTDVEVEITPAITNITISEDESQPPSVLNPFSGVLLGGALSGVLVIAFLIFNYMQKMRKNR